MNTIVIPAGTFKEGTRVAIRVSGQITEEPVSSETEFKVTKPIERKLEGFARRLRAFGNHKGSTNIGADRYEIQVDRVGYTVLSKNGKANPALEA